MLSNMKITTRLVLSFSVVILIMIIMSLSGILNFIPMADMVKKNYEESTEPMVSLVDFSIPYGVVRAAMRDLYFFSTQESNEKQKASLETNYALMEKAVSNYMKLLEDAKKTDSEEYASLSKIATAMVTYKDALFNRLVPAGMENRNEDADRVRAEELVEPGAIIRDEIKFLTEYHSSLKESIFNDTEYAKNNMIFFQIALTGAGFILSFILATLLIRSIIRPVKSLMDIAHNISKGNLKVNRFIPAKNEIGTLVSNIYIVIDTIEALTDDLNDMANQHNSGEIDAVMNESKYEGSYKEVAISVNQMVSGHIESNNKTLDCLSQVVGGNFDAYMEKLPGKRARINDAIENLRVSLKGIAKEVDLMIENAVSGNLSYRLDSKKYIGDWGVLFNGFNNLLNAISTPIIEAESILRKVAEGNLDNEMKGEYKGDFLLIKNSINNMISILGNYIDEISKILTGLSQNDLNQSIVQEYKGEFSNIKIALNKIIDNFNDVVSDIASVASQLNVGSRQISEGSISVANGAMQQASAVEELNNTISAINENSTQNARSTEEVNNLSVTTRDNALKGSRDMKEMLTAIASIKESSDNISKIIKTIDDIAFQTNLLALNAAVEAARAGEYGSGFAVVADEVRNLAGKCKEAAGETSHLIEESIRRVDDGTKIADTTAAGLDTIVEDITDVAEIIARITKASNKQAEAIEEAVRGLSQITDVAHNNSSMSEEYSSTSQTLSSQAEILHNLVQSFRLKTR